MHDYNSKDAFIFYLIFILCLSNCGAPLTLNFVCEFISLYEERLPVLGVFLDIL